jgi:hypothetical protein
MWVEQSYKQIKGALGWAEYHVRADQAIQRHWNLVCCAFTFCWWHASHTTVASAELSDVARDGFAPAEGLSEPNGEKKNDQPGAPAPKRIVASRIAAGSRVVGAVDHASAVLESVVEASPARGAPAGA